MFENRKVTRQIRAKFNRYLVFISILSEIFTYPVHRSAYGLNEVPAFLQIASRSSRSLLLGGHRRPAPSSLRSLILPAPSVTYFICGAFLHPERSVCRVRDLPISLTHTGTERNNRARFYAHWRGTPGKM